MHSPFPYAWAATAPAFSTSYQPLDDTSADDTPLYTDDSSVTYTAGRDHGLLSPVDEDVWSTFNYPSSPLPDDSEYQPGAYSSSAFIFPTAVAAAVPASSSSSPPLTPAIRHLRLQSELSIFPSLTAQQSTTAVSATSTPQRSSPGSPTVAAFLANPELLPKLLGRGKHQPQPVKAT